jgi:DNA repair exonuclease SbcCD nuclease subunit
MSDLIIGDPHLKIGALDLSSEFLLWIEKIANEKQVDRIIYMGDVFHTHSVIRTEVMNLFNEHLKRIKGEVNIIVGNHDMSTPSTPTSNSLSVFKDKQHVRIIDELTVRDNEAWIPYIHNSIDFNELIEKVAHKVKKVYCHQQFIGSDMGFIKAADGSSPIEGLSYVCGHIHKRQKIGNVWYVGTPFAQEASDVNIKKGVWIVQGDEAPLFVKSPFPEWKQYTATTENYSEVLASMNPKDKNYLILSGVSGEIAAIQKQPDFKSFKKDLGFKVKKDVVIGNKAKIETLSIISAIEDYVDKVYNGGVDRQEIKKYCRGLIK